MNRDIRGRLALWLWSQKPYSVPVETSHICQQGMVVVNNSAPDNIVIYELFSYFSTNMLSCCVFKFSRYVVAVHTACLVHLHVGLVWNQCCGC